MSELLPSDALTFAVGEVVILQYCTYPQNEGKEATILALPEDHDWVNLKGTITTAGRYIVETGGEIYGNAERRQLRKKRPPAELSSWDEVQKDTKWNPTEVYA